MSSSVAVKVRPHKPSWGLLPFRILVITFLLTLFSFAVCLLLGIMGVIVAATLHGHHPNMALAYRDVAFPAGMVIGSLILIITSVVEIRRFRQARALAAIENAG